jgi:transcriptional regulator with XRE-family HTH domain
MFIFNSLDIILKLNYHYLKYSILELFKGDSVMTIGDRIRKFRDIKNISTYKLSEMTGIPQSTISKLENGRRKSDNEVLSKIADALMISVERLTGESVSSIIEDRIEETGMTITEIATKANVPIYWLMNIDSFVPGEFGNENEIGYTWISQVAEVIGVSGSVLRAALARQEMPVSNTPIISPEEANFNNDSNYDPEPEYELLMKFKKLNQIGKQEAIKRVEELTYVNKYIDKNNITKIHNLEKVAESTTEYSDHLQLKAAHEIEGATKEDKKHDEDIMNDENF